MELEACSWGLVCAWSGQYMLSVPPNRQLVGNRPVHVTILEEWEGVHAPYYQ